MKNRYAVCLNTSRDDLYADDWWIEFVRAEDQEEAEQKMEEANPHCAIVTARPIPRRGIFGIGSR